MEPSLLFLSFAECLLDGAKDYIMQVVIAGGSGFIGRKLIEALLRAKHNVTLLSRDPARIQKSFPFINVEFWDTKSIGSLAGIINGKDAVINLAGESIASKRWSSKQKQKILSSRIESTRAIVQAIEQAQHRPSVLLNASAVGYYGHVPEDEVTETYPNGAGFLAGVCGQWEKEAQKIQKHNVRVVLLRTGIILDKNEGALRKFLLPFKMFVGGPLGNGRQWFPWIHVQDEIDAILFAMEHEQIEGPVNLSAPESIRMREFCSALGSVIGRPSWLRVPGFALRLMLGEMAGLILYSQRIIPQKLLNSGFKFRYPNLEKALQDILR